MKRSAALSRCGRHPSMAVVDPTWLHRVSFFSTVQESNLESAHSESESNKDRIMRDLLREAQQSIDEMISSQADLRSRFGHELKRVEFSTNNMEPRAASISRLNAPPESRGRRTWINTVTPSSPISSNLHSSDMMDNQYAVNRSNGDTDEPRQEGFYGRDMSNQLLHEQSSSIQAGATVSSSSAPYQSDLMDLLNDSHEVSHQSRFNTDVDQSEDNLKGTAAFRPSTTPAPSLMDLLSESFDNKNSETNGAVSAISSDATDSGEGISTPLHSTAQDEWGVIREVSHTTSDYTGEAYNDPGSNHNAASEMALYNEVLSRGIAYLASMSDHHWGLLNDDEDDDDEEEEEVPFDAGKEFVEEEEIVDELDPSDATSQNDQNAVDEPGSESETLMQMEGLLMDAFSGDLYLSTEDYNLILLYMACTSAYKNHDITTMLLQIHTHMNSAETKAQPDGFTYVILILALSRRGQAPVVASQLVIEMMHQDHLFHNAEALVQAMKCLERCKRRELAERLLRPILKRTDERMPIPVDAITSMLRMYQFEQMTVETMDLIDDYIAAAGMVPDVSRVFRTALNWPRWASNCRQDDVKTLFAYLFNVFKSSENKPGKYIQAKLWGMLIEELAKSSPFQVLTAETEMIREAVWMLLHRERRYYPDSQVLMHGLDAALCHDDSNLAAALMQRILERPVRRHPSALSNIDIMNSETKQSAIPPQAFKLAINTCVAAKCATSISTLLNLLDHPDVDIPPGMISQFMHHALVGFIGACEWDKATATLSDMATRGLGATDDACGAVIQGLAMNGRSKDALQLFQEIKAGAFGDLKPGPLSYTAKMVALTISKEWQAVIDVQREMQELGMPSSSVVIHAVILASMRMGDKSSVVEAIEQGIRSGVSLNLTCFEQALKCLLPDLACDGLAIPTIRSQLRERVDVAPKSHMAQQCLNLSRALRVAQIEEDRSCSRNVGAREINNRRHTAWMKAHQSLLELYRSTS